MNVTIPIYIENVRSTYLIQPLFHEGPVESHRDLSRGTTAFVIALRKHLTLLGREDRQDNLASMLFCPDVEERQLSLSLQLRRQTVQLTLTLAVFRCFSRRIAFSPSLSEIWFTVDRGEDLEERAEVVYTDHFRQLERDDELDSFESYSQRGKAWITTIDVDFAPRKLAVSNRASHRPPFALLGFGRDRSGAEELEEVGRCLDYLYPDDLGRAFDREVEVEEMIQILSEKRPRPTVLIGRPKVGKTALIHEYVYRTIDARGGRFSSKRRCWLVAPQRLIAGMSYVGQWEQRLLAVLKEAKKRRHVLYFNDLLGLFRAGISASSSLSVGHVLKDFIERRDVTVLGEITPEAFNVLKEIDRGFADLFHVIPIKEPRPLVNLKILIRQLRELEGRHRCRFHPGALPRVIELQRRYARQLAFPGKAAVFLERLAVKYARRHEPIDAEMVLDEFHRTCGLSRTFIDDRSPLQRSTVCEALEERLMGQPQAIEALADVVSIGKARLQDPTRPLASCLFLGPTGVGKTQAAKALARYLMGDESKLLRFDMNEQGDAGSAGRLVGTFSQPSGQLTSAVANAPFAVILLDEIEKAHPAVFDLLLQVLDDGRLTDAGGNTVDFTGTIIILTSNLGADEAGKLIGFDKAAAWDEHLYAKAAERFFRPEFFNRLDRIVPFSRLDRGTIRSIAESVLGDVLHREGLRRRKSLLDLHPDALESIVELGFHPKLGARALKRAVEQSLTRPVATQLSAIAPGKPLVVSFSPNPKRGFDIALQGLSEVSPIDVAPEGVDFDDTGSVLKGLEAACVRLDDQLGVFKPGHDVTATRYQMRHRVYYGLRDLLRKLCSELEEIRDSESAPNPDVVRTISIRDPAKSWVRRWDWTLRLEDIRSTDQLRDYLKEILQRTKLGGSDLRDRLLKLVRLISIVNAIVEDGPERSGDRAALCTQTIGGGRSWPGLSLVRDLPLEHVAKAEAHDEILDSPEDLGWRGLWVFSPRAKQVTFQGPRVIDMLETEAGSHLFWRSDGGFSLTVVKAVSIDGRDELELLCKQQRSHESSPFPSIVRLYGPEGQVVDLKTGLVFSSGRDCASLSPMLHTQWPLPSELKGQ